MHPRLPASARKTLRRARHDAARFASTICTGSVRARARLSQPILVFMQGASLTVSPLHYQAVYNALLQCVNGFLYWLVFF